MTIYLSWGFYQLPMEPKSQNNTAFSTPFGSLQMATHANVLGGQSEYISKSNGTRACWTHMEHYGTLFG